MCKFWVKDQSNPYQKFLEDHNEAKVDDLRDYLGARTRIGTTLTTIMVILVASFGIGVTSFYSVLDQTDILLYIIVVVVALAFMGGAVLGFVIWATRIVSPQAIKKDFEMYYKVKKRMEAGQNTNAVVSAA